MTRRRISGGNSGGLEGGGGPAASDHERCAGLSVSMDIVQLRSNSGDRDKGDVGPGLRGVPGKLEGNWGELEKLHAAVIVRGARRWRRVQCRVQPRVVGVAL